jgi:hypothetical protein
MQAVAAALGLSERVEALEDSVKEVLEAIA